jgi:hypothetical protein
MSGFAGGSLQTNWLDKATGQTVDMSRGFNCSIFYCDGTG